MLALAYQARERDRSGPRGRIIFATVASSELGTLAGLVGESVYWQANFLARYLAELPLLGVGTGQSADVLGTGESSWQRCRRGKAQISGALRLVQASRAAHVGDCRVATAVARRRVGLGSVADEATAVRRTTLTRRLLVAYTIKIVIKRQLGFYLWICKEKIMDMSANKSSREP